MPEHIHFVTGRLAESALRNEVAELAVQFGFSFSIDVLPITVAALMTPAWIAPRIRPPSGTNRILIPGYCEGDMTPLIATCATPIEKGPKDLRRLSEHFGAAKKKPADLDRYEIEILAEINHAPRLSLEQIISLAKRYASSGADVIDLGCEPGSVWLALDDAVKALRDIGLRVSVDTFEPAEASRAAKAGAELVLSVNSSNLAASRDWGVEVVAIPDDPATGQGLESTIHALLDFKVPFRIDPILEPIGFGFAASLRRYFDTRARWPQAKMLMGIGNLTELTEVDSAGVNLFLLAICQELGIQSVLTTEVIGWAQSSVKECDLARRMVSYAIREHSLPKHIDDRLVLLRDRKVMKRGDQFYQLLSQQIKDHNFRIFVEGEEIRLVSKGMTMAAEDPFELFEALQWAIRDGGQSTTNMARDLTPGHAFYLGYEMAKAVTAITLSKEYHQDESLRWGFLTREETSHRLGRTAQQRETPMETDLGGGEGPS